MMQLALAARSSFALCAQSAVSALGLGVFAVLLGSSGGLMYWPESRP